VLWKGMGILGYVSVLTGTVAIRPES
jgi:hypothetical protein